MNLETVKRVFFLGIGGIGMSALARYFHAKGLPVAGYDLTPSSLTADLESLGIAIHFEDSISRVPEAFRQKEHTLVVRTPAVPADHTELVYFLEQGFEVRKRAEVLGWLFNQQRGLAIAGTHGKTSVSSMTAFILHRSPVGCNAFLGGILKNLNSNLILHPESPWVVAEADEFDRSFLQLYPEVALVTWVDADHLDIYHDEKDVQDTFARFVDQTKQGGTVILKKSIALDFDLAGRSLLYYALDDEKADFFALNITCQAGRYTFDIKTPEGIIEQITMQCPGLTNVENAVAAAALSTLAGVDRTTIRTALSEFAGVQRRFDVQYQGANGVYIDDYAHHPRELDALIGSVRRLFPGQKITGIFQPHLFSRTRDFAPEFAESLSALDKLILLDIYPAREKPIQGITSEIIYRAVTLEEKQRCSKVDLLSALENEKFEVLLTIGAGDIDRLVAPIKQWMENR